MTAIVLTQEDGTAVVLTSSGPAGMAGAPTQHVTVLDSSPYRVANGDANGVLVWPGPGGCDVEIPDGLAPGFTCRVVVGGTGAVTIVAIGEAAVVATNDWLTLITLYRTAVIVPIGLDVYLVEGGETTAGGMLDFSDPDNSALAGG